MNNFLDTILTPFTYAVSWVLWAFHELFTRIGMDEGSGVTWTLSIIFLVLLIRTLLIPVFVKQIKSQRAMQALQPDLRKLQAKYKGKTDQMSRQAMVQEQQALFKKHKTNPLSSCLPLLIQMPFFFALFRVLNNASHASENHQAVGALSVENIRSFDSAQILGAPLSETFLGTINSGNTNWAVVIVAVIMILAMIASQFFTQRQLMTKNMSKEALEGPFMQQQKMMLYILPLVFGIGGINFPIGVLIYWTATNLWTLCQQFWVIRNNPTPGSQAERELNARRAEKGLPPVGVKKEDAAAAAEEAAQQAAKGQREQPKRNNRRKKK
ncbi:MULTISPECIES: membrane protein insertase YidC [Glutamicibacter]|uniref:Membrane protein insertase YidC n=1 Tax=Glutamicibacter halophytocola TaxID=1933880 RepID=A0A5B8IMK6_9MICC|nr:MULTISPECIES: membrane protein insertase YidC [Glutamicibacter]MBF6673089.1 membrane protein insertase YidC [Glutamicibacter sp. FBE19]NQD42578.1 membrane protein insertase YidC [Glutamicibacter halophytocola]QDY66924.1 membrane protein insertase YidC [Glutamicibacter halophytocola]UUX59071.1 membrane protein insertase YidC [Glutamicibacter halophytocola]